MFIAGFMISLGLQNSLLGGKTWFASATSQKDIRYGKKIMFSLTYKIKILK